MTETISGRGALLLSDGPLPVEYRIVVTEARGVKSASGSLRGDQGKLMSLMMGPASHITMRLEDGREADIMLSQGGTSGFRFQVSGPIRQP